MTIKIAGNAMVITSTIKLEDIKFLKKTDPDALKIKDKEGNTLYAMDVKPGSLTKAGATFDTANEDGFAEATILMPAEIKADKRIDWVKENYAAAFVAFEINEAQYSAYAENLKTVYNKAVEGIVVL